MQLNNLETRVLGKNVFYYDTIDSTQAEIWRLYEKEIENGTLIIAGIQTEGIGTHGRKWYTDEKNNISFSFYMEMKCSINKLENLTLDIAKIIVQIFKETYKINLSIKKPNDIVYKNKKIGGILTQTKVVKDYVKAVVIGVGINTSQVTFDDDIKEIATSIKKEFNVDVDIEKFIKIFCEKIEKEIYERIKNK